MMIAVTIVPLAPATTIETTTMIIEEAPRLENESGRCSYGKMYENENVEMDQHICETTMEDPKQALWC